MTSFFNAKKSRMSLRHVIFACTFILFYCGCVSMYWRKKAIFKNKWNRLQRTEIFLLLWLLTFALYLLREFARVANLWKKSTHIQAEMRARCVNKHKQVALIFALKGINIIREMSRGGFFSLHFCFLFFALFSLFLSPVIPKDSTADLTKKSLPTCFFSSPSFFLCFYYVHFLFIFSKSLFSFPFLSWGHGCLVFYGRFFCTIFSQNFKVFRWGGVGGQECNS